MPRMLIVFFMAICFVAAISAQSFAGTTGIASNNTLQYKGSGDGLASLLKTAYKKNSDTNLASAKGKTKTAKLSKKSGKTSKQSLSSKKASKKSATLKSKSHKKKSPSKMKTAKRSAKRI
jgi:hypothetical protein